MLGYINEATKKALINPLPRTPLLYVLPEIHKKKRPPVGKPMVSSSNSLLQPLSKYADHFLQPFVSRATSYIKDTEDFISKIENMQIPESASLLPMDVTSIYTSIPHKEACRVVEDVLSQCESLHPSPIHF